jgi:hypothetical protein
MDSSLSIYINAIQYKLINLLMRYSNKFTIIKPRLYTIKKNEKLPV